MTDPLGLALLARARNAIGTEFGLAPLQEPADATLEARGAVFVTLTQLGRLRGCIGSLEAWRPLDADVRGNARAAAFRDPRFAPLTAEEFSRTRVEVSLLTPAVPISFVDQEDAVRQLRPGVDGVILEYEGQRGTFLPQVWENLPDRHAFLAQLKQKAGLSANFWAPGVKLFRYQVQKWREPETS